MNTIPAIIIEDEAFGLNNLQNILQQHCPQVEVIGTADTVRSGINLLNNPHIHPSVVFMDINLPDGTVFQLIDELNKVEFEIIFVTAHEDHAIKACQYSSIGYIVKPIDPDLLVEAVERVSIKKPTDIHQRLDVLHSHYNNPNAFRKMAISALDGIYFVNFGDILRLEAEDNYTHIHLKNGERMTASKTIKSYESMLSPYNFYRVHKRHVINLNYMRKFVKGDGGYLIMDDGIRIEVSRRRRPAFMEQMRRLQEGI